MNDIQMQAFIESMLPRDLDVKSMQGFKMDLSANADFRKLFFSVSCDCGTSAILSVEVSKEKTPVEIENAIPSLADGLKRQASAFRSMSCDLHTRMRLGPLASEKTA